MRKIPREILRRSSPVQLKLWMRLTDELNALERAYSARFASAQLANEIWFAEKRLPPMPSVSSPFELPQIGLFDAQN